MKRNIKKKGGGEEELFYIELTHNTSGYNLHVCYCEKNQGLDFAQFIICTYC